MTTPLFAKPVILLGFIFCLSILNAQTNDEFIVGDALPDAPELSARGPYKIGVQTLDLVNKGQIDVLKSKDGIDPLYDRPLKIEVWYPAIVPEGTPERVVYDEVLEIGRASCRERV